MARAPSTSSRSRKPQHRNSLAADIASTGPLRTKSNKRKGRIEDDGDRFVDSRASRKILKIGQDLVAEEQAERVETAPNSAFTFDSRFGEGSEAGENNQEEDEEDGDTWGDEDEGTAEDVEIDPNDLELFNKFMPVDPGPTTPPTLIHNEGPDEEGSGTNLANLILEKIAAHEAAQNVARVIHGGGLPEDAVELPAKVVEVYSKIGLLLSRYKSGKLPKPFKILSTLPQWEALLSITRPELWSPNACYEATKIFVSSRPIVTQRFLETVILHRVRDDIHETKKLNVHLYNALKKALYKPAAFFKGFLFPLVGSGTCTLREAHIISSVLVKMKVPVLHSAAALLRLTEIAAEQASVSTENAGASNIFIRVLLEKKYALPYKVIDSLVFHFLRFRGTPSASEPSTADETAHVALNNIRLPVLWHQCLLAFAQRYRNDITEDQREALLDLLLIRGHKDIGPEVRRELLEGRGRGVAVEEGNGDGGDDTMITDPY